MLRFPVRLQCMFVFYFVFLKWTMVAKHLENCSYNFDGIFVCKICCIFFILLTFVFFFCCVLCILFYFDLFSSIQFYIVLFCSVLFCFVPFCSILFHFVPFCSILFHFVPFCSISGAWVPRAVQSARNCGRPAHPQHIAVNPGNRVLGERSQLYSHIS